MTLKTIEPRIGICVYFKPLDPDPHKMDADPQPWFANITQLCNAVTRLGTGTT